MRLFATLAGCVAVALFVLPVHAQPVGVTSLTVPSDEPGRAIAVTLWYPAAGAGRVSPVGANAVFAGAEAMRGAPPAPGSFPTVLLSHGGLRSAPDSGAWLAARLAARGMLVAEVRGPKPATPHQAPDEFWQRPADISAALTALTGNSDWNSHVDRRRIAAVGFYLGGTAVLALEGARFDPDAFLRMCDDARDDADCAWLEAGQVSLRSVTMPALTRTYRDERIAAVVAVEPEHVGVFAAGLSAVHDRVMVVRLGPGAPGPGDRLPNIDTHALANATVFDGFGPCTPKGAAILADDGGDPALCGSTAGGRTQVHDALAGVIVEFLARRFP